jgi:nitrate reductase gamma subunit
MRSTTAFQQFWWVILPYIALVTFVIGHIWRYRYDQFGWTSRSTELQEKPLLKWGSPIFHYGALAAIAGHVIGILIPERWTADIGIPEVAYRWFAATAGSLAAILVIIGVAILAFRRLFVVRVRATTSLVDWVALVLLAIVILLGALDTMGTELLGRGYDYRQSVALWFRGLFAGNPDVYPIAHAPFVFQIHATAAWALILVWPFSRLVHAWSYPVWYLWRPFIVFRRRVAAPPNEPGTSGRRWRKIGVPY